MPDLAPTRSAALALTEERMLMRQGFGFLDEKRMLLAAELLRLARRCEEATADVEARRRAANAALQAAVERAKACRHSAASTDPSKASRTGASAMRHGS